MDGERGQAIRAAIQRAGGLQGIIGTVQGLRTGPTQAPVRTPMPPRQPRQKTDYMPALIVAGAALIAAMIARGRK
jgi:hypothetical protein